ncbi:hypothetical protein OZ656_15285 [Marinobacter sp. LM1]|jgi:hypothetical protein|uniref:hypothetical protein n=1 Tax=Marinobacter sp. LM1 TaxID=3003349 RepID=UPI0036D3B009|tara:strand:+ start:410 stop:805 length:396 start_codon:yes stop_codon:yes gene_type:complete
MNEGQMTDLVVILGALSLGIGFILLLLMVTLLFRKTAEVERRVATPGKQLDEARSIWGNGPIGRWMRVMYVYAFVVFRHIPRIGPRIKSRMGDEKEPLPLSLKLWIVVPFTVYAVLMFLFFFSGWYIGAFD